MPPVELAITVIAMVCSRLSDYSFAPLFGTQFWSTINGAKRHYPTGTGRHRASASPLVGHRGHCTQGLGPRVGAGRCFVWVCSRLSDYYVLTGIRICEVLGVRRGRADPPRRPSGTRRAPPGLGDRRGRPVCVQRALRALWSSQLVRDGRSACHTSRGGKTTTR